MLSVEDAIGIRERVLESLVERRILERRDKRFLWSFRSGRYPIVDGRAEREVKLRIRNVLFSEEIPDPRDVALIGLADACHLFDDVFLDRDVEQWRPRIDQLGRVPEPWCKSLASCRGNRRVGPVRSGCHGGQLDG